MFVNYMPFLILSLMGTDRYFQKKKSGLLTGSVFLMIMTSFYFSIGGILVLFIYGVFQYLDIQEKQRKKSNCKELFSVRYFVLHSYFNSGYDKWIFVDTYSYGTSEG